VGVPIHVGLFITTVRRALPRPLLLPHAGPTKDSTAAARPRLLPPYARITALVVNVGSNKLTEQLVGRLFIRLC